LRNPANKGGRTEGKVRKVEEGWFFSNSERGRGGGCPKKKSRREDRRGRIGQHVENRGCFAYELLRGKPSLGTDKGRRENASVNEQKERLSGKEDRRIKSIVFHAVLTKEAEEQPPFKEGA